MGKIDVDKRYNPAFFQSLSMHPLVAEIENWGYEDGRFCVWLKEGVKYASPYEENSSMSFGSIKEARKALKKIKQVGQ